MFGSTRSQIVRCEPRVLRDAGKHSRADLVAVMEGEDVVGPSLARERAVRAGLPLHGPADAQQCGEDEARLGRPPRRSRGEKGDVEELWDGFAMVEAIGECAPGQRLHLGDGIGPGDAVSEDAGDCCDLGDPAAVRFLVEFDG